MLDISVASDEKRLTRIPDSRPIHDLVFHNPIVIYATCRLTSWSAEVWPARTGAEILGQPMM
jgi:hypothetical protein